MNLSIQLFNLKKELMRFYYKSLKLILLNRKSLNNGLDRLENLIQEFKKISKIYGKQLLKVSKQAEDVKNKKLIMINFLKQFMIITKKQPNLI